jgi:hypothetical protein
MRRFLLLGCVVALGCGDDSGEAGDGTTGAATDETSASSTMTSGTTASTSGTGSTSSTTASDSTGDADTSDGSTDDTGGGDDGPNVDVSDPQLYEFELDPQELDPTVQDYIETQYAQLDTRAEPIGKLVFFLSGFTNTPGSWRDHGRQLASYGFHVVLPHYNNSWSCSGGPPNCNEDTRWEALTGEDSSSIVDVIRADSAEGRVVTMLLHLRDIHPVGDWGYYLDDDDNLRYEHVIIAGISHGASSSGLFATRRPFHRVAMHSGAWGNVGDDPVTPIELFYSLSHQDDEQHPAHLSAWDSAGLLGTPTVIEEVTAPYGDSRRLVATTPNTYPHCSVVVHSSSPIQDDEYVFDPAWRTMYGVP